MSEPDGGGTEADVAYRGLATDPRLLTLTAISAVGVFGTNAVSPALPYLAETLGVSDAEVGLVITAFALPQIALILLIGLLADIYGRRIVLLPSLVLFGAAGVVIGFVDSFGAVLALRVVQGMVTGGVAPLTITIVGESWEGATGAAAQGFRLSANGLTSLVVPAVAGGLAGLAWYYPFYLFGVAFPVAALGYRYLPETGRPRTPDSPLSEVRDYARALRVEMRDRDLGIILLGGLFQGVGWYAVLTFVPLFAVRSLGATAFAAGLALSMRGAGRIVIAPFAGLVMTLTSRRIALGGSLIATAVCTAAIAAAPSVAWLFVAVALFGVADAVFTPIHRDTLADLPDAEQRAGVVNGMIVLRQVGATVSPVAFGVVLAIAGFEPVFVLAGGVYAAFGVVVLAFFSRG